MDEFPPVHLFLFGWYFRPSLLDENLPDGGDADLRVNGTDMELTSIPDEEWKVVEDAAGVFWDEIAQESETKAKVVQIFKDYNEVMNKAGKPYRY